MSNLEILKNFDKLSNYHQKFEHDPDDAPQGKLEEIRNITYTCINILKYLQGESDSLILKLKDM